MDAAAWDARYAASELVWSAGPHQLVEEGRNAPRTAYDALVRLVRRR